MKGQLVSVRMAMEPAIQSGYHLACHLLSISGLSLTSDTSIFVTVSVEITKVHIDGPVLLPLLPVTTPASPDISSARQGTLGMYLQAMCR